jgi:hypothetical protein
MQQCIFGADFASPAAGVTFWTAKSEACAVCQQQYSLTGGKMRNIKMLQIVMVAFLAAFSAVSAQAGLATYNNKALFLADTGASLASAAYPDAGQGPYTTYSSGAVTFSSSNTFYFGAYTSRLVGGVISIDSFEHLSVQWSTPVYSFGFDFVEPEFDPLVNAPFVDSTFSVTLRNVGLNVGTFQFNTPSDTAAFVGAWSTVAFDRVDIVETAGGIENEFYGQFYSGTATPIPEPSTFALLLAGLGFVGFNLRRRSVQA